MNKRLMLQLAGAPLEFEVRRVMVAGYTGRDTNQVQAHIAELERQGIPAPPTVPTVYPLDASYATTDTEITIEPRTVSGEAEPALLFPGSTLEDALVSVIVDFTAGMYACRPPGMKHGPWKTSEGCTTFEVRYFTRPK